MMDRTAISIADYLRTSYEHAPDYLAGEVVNRSMPGTWHSKLQITIGTVFTNAEASTGLYCYSEIHLPVASNRYRIADIAIFKGAAEEPYPLRAPLGVVEIVSPDDSYPKLVERLRDYHAWGVPYIWLIDPEHKLIHRYDGASLLAVDAIELPEPAFRLPAADLFARLA